MTQLDLSYGILTPEVVTGFTKEKGTSYIDSKVLAHTGIIERVGEQIILLPPQPPPDA